MNLKQNFSDKIHNFSTKCSININKNLFFYFPKKLLLQKALVSILKKTLYIVVISRIKCEFAAQPSQGKTSVAGSERGSGSEVGAETNHSGSTILGTCSQYLNKTFDLYF
jgi:hypothetical protein